MAVHPLIRAFLTLNTEPNGPDPRPVAERRAADARGLTMRTVMRRTRRPLKVTEHRIPVTDGEITVRVSTPLGPGPHPAHVYFHGGAFWLGSMDEYDPLCRWYAAEAGCAVVNVDYRLAPEHPYPTPPEDCYAAFRWTVTEATDLGIDPARVSVGGTSAGGSLAAAVTLMARDRGGPAPTFQLLEIPTLDATLSSPSIAEFATGHLLTRDFMREAADFYVPDESRRREPYASPLLAEDLTSLPPARIAVAECDPLRDEGESYGARLRQAGVPVEVRRYAGHVHGSLYVTRALPSARRFLADNVAALREAHTTD
ncbi:alpha/beta hydrolase [Actinomadura kijaniata]|uniref:alpha/beta hydrolase n=1 Tax=Actinomadura kijaniata TaxID=46161 RepID=UPI00082F44C4|nr:alpha/beta hydrolase [Actinomadura kijaniata]